MPKDHKKSMQYYSLAAANGGRKNHHGAASWYLKAAEAGEV